MPIQIRLYLEIGAAVVLLAAFGLFVHHERQIGAQTVSRADARALGEAQKRADAETALNHERAAKAQEIASNVQQKVDDYVAAHAQPDGKPEPIRLCRSAGDRLPGRGEAGPLAARADGAGTGSAALPAVPAGGESEGPDVSPELDEIVRSAARVAVLYDELQQRQSVKLFR